MRQIGAFWKPKDENSKAVATGVINQVAGCDCNAVIVPNEKKKEGDNQPDFLVLEGLQQKSSNTSNRSFVKKAVKKIGFE